MLLLEIFDSAEQAATFVGLYPRAGKMVDGREVMSGPIQNTDSISASLMHYRVLKGIREVPMSEFGQMDIKNVASAREQARIKDLASRIKYSEQIMPLIVVVDQEGPYVLEGIHRLFALHLLGAKSFPALVVVDEEHLYED